MIYIIALLLLAIFIALIEAIRFQKLGLRCQAEILRQLELGADGAFLMDGDLADRTFSEALLRRLRSMQRLQEKSEETTDQILEYIQLSPGQRETSYRARGLSE